MVTRKEALAALGEEASWGPGGGVGGLVTTASEITASVTLWVRGLRRRERGLKEDAELGPGPPPEGVCQIPPSPPSPGCPAPPWPGVCAHQIAVPETWPGL